MINYLQNFQIYFQRLWTMSYHHHVEGNDHLGSGETRVLGDEDIWYYGLIEGRVNSGRWSGLAGSLENGMGKKPIHRGRLRNGMPFCRNERHTKETEEMKGKAEIRVLAWVL